LIHYLRLKEQVKKKKKKKKKKKERKKERRKILWGVSSIFNNKSMEAIFQNVA
jgi:hypothetical protein